MKAGIRTKFIGAIALAVLVPLIIAAVAVQTVGYEYLVEQRGKDFNAVARDLAQDIRLMVAKEAETLEDFLVLCDLPQLVAESSALDAKPREMVDALESRWAQLAPDSPELQSLLSTPPAEQLHLLHSLQPFVVELLVTNKHGELVAATSKTSDFFQGDERWWQEAIQMKPGQSWIEGIHHDESAGILSIDIALPVRAPGAGAEMPPAGAIKAVLDASRFLGFLQFAPSEHTIVPEICAENGDVLLRVSGAAPSHPEEAIDRQTAARIAERFSGWMLAPVSDAKTEMIGFVPLRFGPKAAKGQEPGMESMFIIVHQPAAEVLAPVRMQLTLLTLGGGVLVLIFLLAGVWVADHHIVRPLELVRSAAQKIAGTAPTDPDVSEAALQASATDAHALVAKLETVKTHDEIESLARDFAVMGRRILNYHAQLELEIAAKTAEIQQDLNTAREFQEALLPRRFPDVPPTPDRAPFRLNFHHLYKPTLSVGGDFFDVIKLSNHKAGVLIADVMGHGARSALITAILRTLIQELTKEADDPVRLLRMINQHFHDIIKRTDQVVYVSAFYLVIDALNGSATFASAGHPSPLLANRHTRKVAPLFRDLKNNPALGIFREAAYSRFVLPIREGDRFILFTDGITEAPNDEGEEFGQARLVEIIRRNLNEPAAGLTQEIADEVGRFSQGQALPDDICLVLVEANQTRESAPPRETPPVDELAETPPASPAGVA